MIRFGLDKPKLFFVHAHNDMGHFTPSHYTTNDYAYLSLDQYMEKLEFDSFPIEQLDAEQKALESGDVNSVIANVMGTTLGQQMDRLIKKSYGQVWQFNAVNPQLDGFVRMVVCLGDKSLRRWSWFDANVTLPILKLTAKVLNFLRTYKTNKEMEKWNAFLNTVRGNIR